MIRLSESGRYYCNGKGCGTDLFYFDGDPEDGGGQLVCMDCNSAIYAEPQTPENIAALAKRVAARKDFLCKNAPKCHECGGDQVRLLWWLDMHPPRWQCRENIGHVFPFEPLPEGVAA